jgi:hypothetical protein
MRYCMSHTGISGYLPHVEACSLLGCGSVCSDRSQTFRRKVLSPCSGSKSREAGTQSEDSTSCLNDRLTLRQSIPPKRPYIFLLAPLSFVAFRFIRNVGKLPDCTPPYLTRWYHTNLHCFSFATTSDILSDSAWVWQLWAREYVLYSMQTRC